MCQTGRPFFFSVLSIKVGENCNNGADNCCHTCNNSNKSVNIHCKASRVKLINQFPDCQSWEIGNGLVEAKTVQWTVFSESRSSYAAHAPVQAFPIKKLYSIFYTLYIFIVVYFPHSHIFEMIDFTVTRNEKNAFLKR